MKHLLLSSAIAVGLAAFTLPIPTAQAAPASPSGLGQPGPSTQPAQMRRRKIMKRRVVKRRAVRRGGVSRRSAPSQEGNAANPNVPVNQQRQGTTTGGPRF